VGRLFWKIFLAFWVALIVAAAGAGTVVWLRHEEAPLPDMTAGPRGGMHMAAAMLRNDGVDAVRGWLQHRRSPSPIYVIDEAGRDILGRPVPPAALERAREAAQRRGDSFRLRSVAAPGGERYLVFAPGGRTPPRPPLALWQLVAIGLVTSLAFSAALAWYLARPIRSLRSAFDSAAAGHLETRISPEIGGRRDEIADLGRDFDRMAAQLQSLIVAQRRLLHDVSHELRSPLARLQAAVGLARQDPATTEASLERIEREASRLDRMVGEILTLARLEGGTTGRKETVDFAHLVASIAEDARFEARALGKDVRIDIAGDPQVAGDAALLHRAVENIVRNAVRFTREGTSVEISLSTSDKKALLSVTDHGPGVADEAMPRIFEPFYRGRSEDGAGFGLGLAIAQRAVEAHGGNIGASNVPMAGLRVEMELPLAA
jgi:two-component system, OmpR family, sensor kinase